MHFSDSISGDPTGLTSRGCWEAKRRIAAALKTDPQSVDLKSYEVDLSGWAFHGKAAVGGKRVFAKIYLHKFNPPLRRIPRYVTPQTELRLLLHPEETFGGSVRNEWEKWEYVASASSDVHLPAICGGSAEEGTLVLEELPGVRLDAYVSWTGWNAPKNRRARGVISRAAAWLGSVHRSSFSGVESVSPRDMLQTVRSILTMTDLDSSRYGDLALEILNDYVNNLHPPDLAVPTCLCHGDFCLANIMWDARSDRLSVFDLEHSVFGNVLHDLCNLVFNLRAQLLYPFTSAAVVKALEGAFWEGYGTTADGIVAAVNALATARLFYFLLPRHTSRRERHGWMGGLESALYGRWFEPAMIERTLQSLQWFNPAPRELVRV